jgi:S-adenosylmethionine hydrolase
MSAAASPRPCGVISLLTDFGSTDAYAGIMRGVLLRFAPGAHLVDLTHEVPAHDVRTAALHLADAIPFFPAGTVHLVVVDPGVGTARRGIAVVGAEAFGVGPDNGVLTPLLERGGRAIELADERFALRPVSATFHGRDLFAPAAAALARGVEPEALGPPVADPVLLTAPQPVLDGDAVLGEIMRVDRFGNLVTNVPARMVAGWDGFLVQAGEALVPGPAANYREGGESLRALVGSAGWIEIALREGNASRALGLGPGAAVVVRRRTRGGE